MDDVLNNTEPDNGSISLLNGVNDSSNTASMAGTMASKLYLSGIFLNIISLVLLVVESMSVSILGKCVLISDQMKVISQNLLIADVSFHGTCVLYTIVSPLEGKNIEGWLSTRLRLGIVYMLLLIYCLMMLLASFDRFISIRNPLQYEKKLPTSTIKRAIRVVWIVTVGVMLLPYICGLSVYCILGNCADNWKPLAFNIYFRMMLSITFLLCDACIVIFYTFILIKSGEQAAKINRIFPSSQMSRRLPGPRIMVIMAAFIVLYSPAVLYTVLFDLLRLEPNLTLIGAFYLVGWRVCTSIHSGISLYFFMYSMPECRMRFMSTYMSWSKDYTERAGEMKVELFNIHIVQRH